MASQWSSNGKRSHTLSSLISFLGDCVAITENVPPPVLFHTKLEFDGSRASHMDALALEVSHLQQGHL